MKSPSPLVYALVVVCGALLTVVLGTWGWMSLPPKWPQAVPTLSDAFYKALLAFGGDDEYKNAGGILLEVTRFLGPFTTASAVLVLFYFFLADAVGRWALRRRKGHLVLIGADAFALSYAEQRAGMTPAESGGTGRLTVIESAEIVEKLRASARNAGTRLVAADLSDPDTYLRDMGRAPAEVILGEPLAHVNAERAISLKRTDRIEAPLVLRSDDDALSREIGLWSERLSSCHTLSEGGFVARSLLTDVDFCDMARLRDQKRVHVAIIGLGWTGLAVAEEVAQRLHHPRLDKTRITAFDKNASEVAWEIRQDFPGLGRAVDFAGPIGLDALHVGPDDADEELKPLFDAVKEDPFTAIVVTTSNDAVNARIAMRLRRAQVEKRLLLAPIFIRMRMSGAISPERVTNLSGGLVAFGGSTVRRRDVALDELQLKFGKVLHDAWRQEIAKVRPREDIGWDGLSVDRQRSNLRAGLSAFDMLRYVGLVPPHDDTYDELRIQQDVGARLSGSWLKSHCFDKAEHSRWCAERFCAGWVQADDGKRDDDSRRHTALVPWDALDQHERDKDVANVLRIVEIARDAAARSPWKPVWRERFRIGVTGPLRAFDGDDERIREEARRVVETRLPAARESLQIEVVCPNAPGFDRRMARALLEAWDELGPAPADVLFPEIGDRHHLDNNAGRGWPEYRGEKDDQDTAATESRDWSVVRGSFDDDWAALEAAAKGRVRRFDVTEGGFRKDLTDKDYWTYGRRIAGMCDLLVAGRRGAFGTVTGRIVHDMAADRLHIVDLPLDRDRR